MTHPIGLPRSLEGASAEQRALYDKIAAGPRGSVPSPFLAMLDVPRLADAIQEVGATIRFAGVLSGADRELAILATAGAVGCRYEWTHHRPIAVTAGVDESAIAATLGEAVAEALGPRAATIIAFCRAVARDRRIDPITLQRTIELVGRAGTSELIAICGYYGLLASFILIGGHEVPG